MHAVSQEEFRCSAKHRLNPILMIRKLISPIVESSVTTLRVSEVFYVSCDPQALASLLERFETLEGS